MKPFNPGDLLKLTYKDVHDEHGNIRTYILHIFVIDVERNPVNDDQWDVRCMKPGMYGLQWASLWDKDPIWEIEQ